MSVNNPDTSATNPTDATWSRRCGRLAAATGLVLAALLCTSCKSPIEITDGTISVNELGKTLGAAALIASALGIIAKLLNGELNHDLTLTLSTRRAVLEARPKKKSVVALKVRVKKGKKGRLFVCDVCIDVLKNGNADAQLTEQLRAGLWSAMKEHRAETSAFRRKGALVGEAKKLVGVHLVPGDVGDYESHVDCGADDVLTFRVRLLAKRLFFGWLAIGKPQWTASAVSLPGKVLGSDLPPPKDDDAGDERQDKGSRGGGEDDV